MTILAALSATPRTKRDLAERTGWTCEFCGAEWSSRAARSKHQVWKHPIEWAAIRKERHAEAKRASARVYKERHPDRVRERVRRWRAENRDHIKSYVRTRWATKRDQLIEEARRYRQTELGRAAKARSDARDKAKGGMAARAAVRSALSRGVLTRQPCQECGETKVQAHHYMGYSPERFLTVQWLCRQHHEHAHHGVVA